MTTHDLSSFESDTYPARLMSDLTVPVPRDEFGQLLKAEPLGLGYSSDVCVRDDTIVALVGGGLSVFRENGDGSLGLIGRLEGLEPTRQLAIEGSIAVVTMREGGMAVIDLSDLTAPKLAAWYDTMELATGVALTEGRAYVTNRHYGVEIIDVTDPAHPRPLGWLRCGEAQSVDVRGGIACIGAWRDRQLVIADVSDPLKPVVIGLADLDGYADGVFIAGNLCYVATGHHTRGIDGFPFEDRPAVTWDMLQQGYGRGHGIEIFDISNPREPRLLHQLKTPPALSKSPDSWRVIRTGQYLLHADSVNGVFVLDLSGPEPVFVGHARVDRPDRAAPANGPSLQERGEPIIGIAMTSTGTIYASGDETDLYRIRTPFRPTTAAPPPARSPVTASRFAGRDPRAIFHGEGMVHSVVARDDMLIAAAGTDGLIGLDRSGAELFRHPFARGARDVVRDGNILIVAGGHEGLFVLRLDGEAVSPRGNLSFPQPVRFVSLVRSGLVLVVLGRHDVALVDVSDPAVPRMLVNARMSGTVYGREVVDGLLAGRYAAAVSQTGGFRWFDLLADGGPAVRPQTGRRSCPITEGPAFVGERALVVRLGGYYLLDPGEEIDPRAARSIRLDEGEIVGVPTIAGDLLIATNRVSGMVHLIDISGIFAPRSIGRIRLDGLAGRPAIDGRTLYVPAGHAGLIALNIDDFGVFGGRLK